MSQHHLPCINCTSVAFVMAPLCGAAIDMVTWIQKCYAVVLYNSSKAAIAKKSEELNTMASQAFGPQTIGLGEMGAADDGFDDGTVDDGHCQQWALGTMGVV